jgi:hypothetical protein
MNEKPDLAVSIIDAIATIISAFIWPVIVLIIVRIFREEIGRLIDRIKSIKVAGSEIITQEEDPEAPAPTKEIKKQMEIIDPQGFRTKEGVEQLISESDLTEKSEKVIDSILIYRTTRQATWLIITTHQVFCVLDDERTRAKARLIQWNIPLSSAQPIRARVSNRGSNVIDIGPKRNWLYSSSLHHIDTELENKVANIISKAQNAT